MKPDEKLNFEQAALVVGTVAQLRSLVICLSSKERPGSKGLAFELAVDKDDYLRHIRAALPPGQGDAVDVTASQARKFMTDTLRACLAKLEGQ